MLLTALAELFCCREISVDRGCLSNQLKEHEQRSILMHVTAGDVPQGNGPAACAGSGGSRSAAAALRSVPACAGVDAACLSRMGLGHAGGIGAAARAMRALLSGQVLVLGFNTGNNHAAVGAHRASSSVVVSTWDHWQSLHPVRLSNSRELCSAHRHA